MITSSEVKTQLYRLISFSPLAPKIKDRGVIKATTMACREIGADETDLDRAVSHIIRNGGPFSGGTNLTQTVVSALHDVGGIQGHRQDIERACKIPPRLCNQGFLFLKLDDLSETCVFCPFCGEDKRRLRNEKYIAFQKSISVENEYLERQEMIEKRIEEIKREYIDECSNDHREFDERY